MNEHEPVDRLSMGNQSGTPPGDSYGEYNFPRVPIRRRDPEDAPQDEEECPPRKGNGRRPKPLRPKEAEANEQKTRKPQRAKTARPVRVLPEEAATGLVSDNGGDRRAAGRAERSSAKKGRPMKRIRHSFTKTTPPVGFLVGGPVLLILLAVVLTLTIRRGTAFFSPQKADAPGDSSPLSGPAVAMNLASAPGQPSGSAAQSSWTAAQGPPEASSSYGMASPQWYGASAVPPSNYPAAALGGGLPSSASPSGHAGDDALRVAGIPSWGAPAAGDPEDVVRTSYNATSDTAGVNPAESEVLRKFVLRNRAVQDVMAQLMRLVDIEARLVNYQGSNGQEEMDEMRREAQRRAWQNPAAGGPAEVVMAVVNPYDNSILTCGTSEKTALIFQAIAAIDVRSY